MRRGGGVEILSYTGIQHGSEELWPGHRFWVCLTVTLTLEICMTLVQGNGTPFGNGQQLRNIIQIQHDSEEL